MTREEAIEIISRPLNMKHAPEDILEAHKMAISALEQPEIVRCRECKHYRALHDQDDLCVYTMTSVEADDYCSYAERKEGQEYDGKR